jgi:hypothetical protein
MKKTFVLFSFFLLLLTFHNKAEAAKQKYFLVHLEQRWSHGMFSNFCYVLGALHEYEEKKYAGIEVDFQNSGLYYDPAYGPNYWSYYCEPIKIGSKKNKKIKTPSQDYEYVRLALLPYDLSRFEAHELITKYIKIKQGILDKVNAFCQANFGNSTIISIHYRGTDKFNEAPRVQYEEIQTKIAEYIQLNNIKNYKIFIATDEQNFVDHMKEVFPDTIISYETERATDGQPLHYKLANQYKSGEDALIDCLLLSRGDILFRTSSNLSLWSSFFNPFIPEVRFNEHYHF